MTSKWQNDIGAASSFVYLKVYVTVVGPRSNWSPGDLLEVTWTLAISSTTGVIQETETWLAAAGAVAVMSLGQEVITGDPLSAKRNQMKEDIVTLGIKSN